MQGKGKAVLGCGEHDRATAQLTAAQHGRAWQWHRMRRRDIATHGRGWAKRRMAGHSKGRADNSTSRHSTAKATHRMAPSSNGTVQQRPLSTATQRLSAPGQWTAGAGPREEPQDEAGATGSTAPQSWATAWLVRAGQLMATAGEGKGRRGGARQRQCREVPS